eukprot:g1115.t1
MTNSIDISRQKTSSYKKENAINEKPDNGTNRTEYRTPPRVISEEVLQQKTDKENEHSQKGTEGPKLGQKLSFEQEHSRVNKTSTLHEELAKENSQLNHSLQRLEQENFQAAVPVLPGPSTGGTGPATTIVQPLPTIVQPFLLSPDKPTEPSEGHHHLVPSPLPPTHPKIYSHTLTHRAPQSVAAGPPLLPLLTPSLRPLNTPPAQALDSAAQQHPPDRHASGGQHPPTAQKASSPVSPDGSIPRAASFLDMIVERQNEIVKNQKARQQKEALLQAAIHTQLAQLEEARLRREREDAEERQLRQRRMEGEEQLRLQQKRLQQRRKDLHRQLEQIKKEKEAHTKTTQIQPLATATHQPLSQGLTQPAPSATVTHHPLSRDLDPPAKTAMSPNTARRLRLKEEDEKRQRFIDQEYARAMQEQKEWQLGRILDIRRREENTFKTIPAQRLEEMNHEQRMFYLQEKQERKYRLEQARLANWRQLRNHRLVQERVNKDRLREDVSKVAQQFETFQPPLPPPRPKGYEKSPPHKKEVPVFQCLPTSQSGYPIATIHNEAEERWNPWKDTRGAGWVVLPKTEKKKIRRPSVSGSWVA